MIDTKCISLLCILICSFMYIFASDTESHVCYPAINRTHHTSYTNISISLDTEKVKGIVTSLCVYEFELASHGAINIELTNKDSHRFRTCRTFTTISFKIDREGIPVKTKNCWDTEKWTVPWPWRKVVVEINLSVDDNVWYTTEPTANLRISAGNFPSLIQQRYIPYKGLINMPQKLFYGDKTPEYCLGDYYYEILYTNQSPYYGAGIKRESKAKFLLIHRSVCIRTYTIRPSQYAGYECPWRVHLSVGNKVLMVLKCVGTYNYWCLPEDWIKRSRELLEISFESIDTSNSAQAYTIKITTNESYFSYGVYRCPYYTTTATAPTTRSTNDDYEKYWSNRGPSVATYLVPVVAILVMVFAFICFGSYIKSKRTSRQRRMQQHRLQMAYTPEGSGQSLPNPAYRTHDPVMDPAIEEPNEQAPSYNDPPPSYSGVMASSPTPEHSTNTATSSRDTPPPPSYEDALAMANNRNSSSYS